VTRLGELSTVRVIRTLGADRYAPAGSLCSEVCRSTLDFYHWDSLVGGALEELLRHVERGVANGMHAQLTVRFGRTDWWESEHAVLHSYAHQELQNARQKLLKARLPVTERAIVGRVSFGFWVSLLGRGIDYETQLWRPALSRAFPRYKGTRVPLHREVDGLRELRNHLAHPGGNPASARNLVKDHAAIYLVMGWISRDTAAWLHEVDRVPTILALRPEACATPCIPQQRSGR
jgi:hypothetical protein